MSYGKARFQCTIPTFIISYVPTKKVQVQVFSSRLNPYNTEVVNHIENTWIDLVTRLFFGHSVSALARWPLPKSKYFISLSKQRIFVWFAHQNSCTPQAYSKTAVKTTIFYDRYVLYCHIYLNMTRKWREQNCSNRQTSREPVRTYFCTNHVWLT